MKSSEAIAVRIVMLCQEKGISYDQLIEKTNADPAVVMAVLKGHTQTAPMDVVGEICLALGITMSEFFHNPLFESYLRG